MRATQRVTAVSRVRRAFPHCEQVLDTLTAPSPRGCCPRRAAADVFVHLRSSKPRLHIRTGRFVPRQRYEEHHRIVGGELRVQRLLAQVPLNLGEMLAYARRRAGEEIPALTKVLRGYDLH